MAQPGQLAEGSWYWEPLNNDKKKKKNDGGVESHGIVVMCAWMLSKPRYLAPYTRLYASCGWDTLVCQPHMLNLFFRSRGAPLAHALLNELAQEIQRRPRPVVLAAFSGGHGGCLHKILELLQGKDAGGTFDKVKRDMLAKCVVGQIYDSCPVDFVTEMGAVFMSHQVLTLRVGRPLAVVEWICNVGANILDMILHSQLERERVALWRAFYSSAIMGPIVILGSDDDEHSPVVTMHKCTSHISDLGGNAKVISWEKSEHVGHLRHHPEEYKVAVRKLLSEAPCLYVRRSEYIKDKESNVEVSSVVSMSEPFPQGLRAPLPALALLAATDAVCPPFPKELMDEITRISNLPHLRGLGHTRIRSSSFRVGLVLLIIIGSLSVWYWNKVLHDEN